MGRRYYQSRPWYYKWSQRWPSIGIGRYMKRRLSKARRRNFKQGRWNKGEIEGGYRGYNATASECNWKTW